jgi:hypothetical protein
VSSHSSQASDTGVTDSTLGDPVQVTEQKYSEDHRQRGGRPEGVQVGGAYYRSIPEGDCGHRDRRRSHRGWLCARTMDRFG